MSLHFAGHTQAQVASILGIGRTAVTMRIARARRRLARAGYAVPALMVGKRRTRQLDHAILG